MREIETPKIMTRKSRRANDRENGKLETKADGQIRHFFDPNTRNLLIWDPSNQLIMVKAVRCLHVYNACLHLITNINMTRLKNHSRIMALSIWIVLSWYYSYFVCVFGGGKLHIHSCNFILSAYFPLIVYTHNIFLIILVIIYIVVSG